MPSPILIGAVAYDPKVITIWDIIKKYFQSQNCPIDYVLYSTYEAMVDALVKGHIHIAWNSPLAWVETQQRTGGHCRAIAMRDTDCDRVSHLIVRRDSEINRVEDLRGKTVATGASDSPQATLIPLHLLQMHGLVPGQDFTVRRFDVLVGKHGDHVGGELQALRSVQQGKSDACAVLDLNWQAWQGHGLADPEQLKILASTPRYDHCNFTVLDTFPEEDERRWTKALFAMSYNNPEHRQMMDMEGLRAWLPGRTTGYRDLSQAVEEQGFLEK